MNPALMKVQILKVLGIRYRMKQKNTVIYKIKNQKLDIYIYIYYVTSSKQTKHEAGSQMKKSTICWCPGF